MDQKNYEQVEIDRSILGDRAGFLLPEMACSVMFYRGRALNADIPQQVELVITYTEPGVRCDTATNVMKPATLETGIEVSVPLFINTGDKVKVDTETGAYLERTAIGNG